VCGSLDTVSLPGEMREMARTIPGARYEELAGAGHLSNLEAPAEFDRALLAFLDGALPD
jgi:pimeloyl-ACP methyl ester carboxylesterase